MESPLISVIVPVYNVGMYIGQCIESILSQTYRNIELIIINDGSTDRSGDLCQKYSDSRIRLFHTDNHGLSEARNYGILRAKGDYISFVDGDDWLEPELLELAIMNIGDSDILCYVKYTNESVYNGQEALHAYLNGKIGCTVWSKLFRKECFQNFAFPNKRIMEDLATTYKLLFQASKVKCAPLFDYYNYRFREDSLSHKKTEKNVIDYWLAFKEMYDYCSGIVDIQAQKCILIRCAEASARAVAWHNDFEIMEHEKWTEMAAFAKGNFTFAVRRQLPIHVHCGVVLSMIDSPVSYWIANRLYRTRKTIHNTFAGLVSDIASTLGSGIMHLGVRQCALKGASHSGQETSTR